MHPNNFISTRGLLNAYITRASLAVKYGQSLEWGIVPLEVSMDQIVFSPSLNLDKEERNADLRREEMQKLYKIIDQSFEKSEKSQAQLAEKVDDVSAKIKLPKDSLLCTEDLIERLNKIAKKYNLKIKS